MRAGSASSRSSTTAPSSGSIYQVLGHDPTHKDIEAFFGRFHAALKARGLTLKGVTTDGSALDPEPIATVFGEVPHRLCGFHTVRTVIAH